MVEWILFKDKRFEKKNFYNLLEFSSNETIILCNNLETMYDLSEEIMSTINGDCPNEFSCNKEDIGKAKYLLRFGLQRVIDINGQRITLCLEPAMVYKAKEIDDMWFFDWSGQDDTYKERIYPLTIFKGSREVWKKGLDKVYTNIVNGRYGCYDGNWIDFNKDV